MNWERQALEEFIGLLVQQHQRFMERNVALRHMGLDVLWRSESSNILEDMTPLWDEYCNPPWEKELNEKYIEIVMGEIEKRYT